MKRGNFAPWRVAILLSVAVLAIGFALAQSQGGGQPPSDTPGSVAQTPADVSSVPVQVSAAEPKEEPASETLAMASAAETEAAAATTDADAAAQDAVAGRTVSRMRSTTQAQRKQAAKNFARRRAALRQRAITVDQAGNSPCAITPGPPCVQVNYFTPVPNFALSKLPVLTLTSGANMPEVYTATGGIRKFANTLAGLGPANKNNLNNYIPVATPITPQPWAAAQGASAGDYYEIGLFDYNHQFHSDISGPCTTAAGIAPSLIGATTCAGTGVATQVRGYKDLNPSRAAAFSGADTVPHYLGPVIIAQTNKPVRVKFTNSLTSTANGYFFLPADSTYMGMTHGLANYSQNRATLHLHGGVTPWISDGTPHQWTVPVGEFAPEKAITIDPANNTTLARGVSVQFVPDMFFNTTSPYAPTTTGTNTDPGPGSLSFFYTNAQSGRFMFYHDHAYGITRLNVYGGEAAGYLLHDGPGAGGKTTLDDLIGAGIPNNAGADLTSNANLTAPAIAALGLTSTNGGLYRFGIPLIIQDKTFVPPATATGAVLNPTQGQFPAGQLAAQDPSWNWGPEGNLWFPHVYMPNQNPNDDSGASIAGRWDYGAWFWPPMTSDTLAHGAIPCVGAGDNAAYPVSLANPLGAQCPGTPNPSGVPESFLDTPVVNGVAYPTVTLPRGAFRFQVLNAANDRMFNLSLFYAADKNGNVCKPGYVGTFNQAATPTANAVPTDFTTCTEVKMVPARPHGQVFTGAPATHTLPATDGDADDTLPACAATATQPDVLRGPGFLVMANAAGDPLASPVLSPAIDYNPFTGLPGGLGSPSGVPCWPSSWPTDGRDGGAPDPASAGPPWVQLGTEGGVLPAPVVIPATPVGYNYNRRDIVVTNVQEHALFLGPAERADVIVDLTNVPEGSTLMLYNDSPAPVPGFDTRLDYYTGDPDQTDTGGAPTTQPGLGPNIRTVMQIHVTGASTSAGFNLATLQSATGIPKVFHDTQPPIIVPERTYSATALGTSSLPAQNSYARIQNTSGLTYTPVSGTGFGAAISQPIINKAIHELFENDYGKMNSILAAELPLSNFNNQTTIPLAYVDPPTEFVAPGQIEMWKVTHNGVDSHAIHFHLFDVQLINRVGWDGAIRPADPNELGWKETVRMNPLEDAIIALRPIQPPLPSGFLIGQSTRLLDPTRDPGATNTAGLPGFTNIDPATNNGVNTVNAVYEYVWHCHLLGHEESDMMRPVVFQVAVPAAPFNLTGHLTGTSVSLAWQYTQGTPLATGFVIQRALAGGPFATLAGASNLPVTQFSFIDSTAVVGSVYSYRVLAFTGPSLSAPSNTVTIANLAAPTNLRRTGIGAGYVIVAWTASSPIGGVNGYALSRCTGTIAACSLPGAVWTTIATSGLTTTQFRNTGLEVGTNYTYRVAATGAGGATSAFSNYLQVTGQ